MAVASQPQQKFTQITYDGQIVHQPVSPYEYKPLSERHNEFRLIRLEPSSHVNSPIRAHLEHHSLQDPPPYVALSYEVGNPGNYSFIAIDAGNFYDINVPVSANLNAALHHLRHLGYLLLWIDSLCIDQTSDEEKNSQILRIQNIYQESRQVVAWLGPEAAGSCMVLRHMRTFPRGLRRPGKKSSQLLKHDLVRILAELRAFFSRTYWQRIWV